MDSFIPCSLVETRKDKSCNEIRIESKNAISYFVQCFTDIFHLFTLRNANIITVLAKNPMERRQGRKFQFWMQEKKNLEY